RTRAGREHRTEDRRAHRTAERPEEAGGGGGDAELAAVDAVLDRDDENLRDHAEAEAEHDDADVDRGPRGIAGDDREQRKRDRHQREAGDRKALVAPGPGDDP